MKSKKILDHDLEIPVTYTCTDKSAKWYKEKKAKQSKSLKYKKKMREMTFVTISLHLISNSIKILKRKVNLVQSKSQRRI